MMPGACKLPGHARAPQQARPYACHNRQPHVITATMQDGWNDVPGLGTREPRMVSVPVRGAPDCRYTLSALGQADQRCAGCRWRAAQAA